MRCHFCQLQKLTWITFPFSPPLKVYIRIPVKCLCTSLNTIKDIFKETFIDPNTILELEIFSPINILIELKPAAKVSAQKRLILRAFTLAAY